jgi:hypothetical protein
VSVSRTGTGGTPQPLKNTADPRRSHPVTELEELALTSLVSPAVILLGPALDQRGHSLLEGPTPDAVRICPLCSDPATMPAQDRARRDRAIPPHPLRKLPDKRGEHRSVRPIQPGPRVGSGQHGDFVTPQELDILRRRRPPEQQQVQNPKEDQIQQTQQHTARSYTEARAHRSPKSTAQTDFWNPTGYPHRRRGHLAATLRRGLAPYAT